MKRLARRYCFWPKIDEDIENLVRSCSACTNNQRLPAQIRTHHWEEPTSNFERIHMDYAGPFHGYYLFIVIDAKSKWPEIRVTRTAPTSATTIEFLQDIFSTHGFPALLVSDNAAIFTSAEFSAYCRKCGIAQRFIAPGHPATNGQAGRFVQTIKHALKPCLETSTLPFPVLVRNILLRHRATPLNSGKSPAELYLHRHLRIQLDALRPLEEPRSPRNLHPKRSFLVGERVLARLNDRWLPGKVTKCLGSLHYDISLDNGYNTKKHVNQLVRSQLQTPAQIPTAASSKPESPAPKRVTFEVTEPVVANPVPAPAPPAEVPVPQPARVEVSPPHTPPANSPPVPRRSIRQRRPPDRLNL